MEVLIPPERIQSRVAELAAEIARAYDGRPVTVVGERRATTGASVPSPASGDITTSIRNPLESSANRPISLFSGTGSAMRPSSPARPNGHPRRESRTSAPAAGLFEGPRNSTVRDRGAGKRTVCGDPEGLAEAVP